MTPLSFEWTWTIDYILFMGLLYMVLLVVGCGLAYAFLKSWLDITEEGDRLPPEVPTRSKYSEY